MCLGERLSNKYSLTALFYDAIVKIYGLTTFTDDILGQKRRDCLTSLHR